MFDEYVEHAGSPEPQKSAKALPHIQYQGFEPGPALESSYGAEVSPTESGYFAGIEPPVEPLFTLSEVQYANPAPLVALAVCSEILFLALSNNYLSRIDLRRPDQILEIPIPRKVSEMTVYKIFLDPSGKHLIITSLQGENFYFFAGWDKPKPLRSFKMVIESVAWNKSFLLSSAGRNSTSTREILLGGRNGTIYEAILDAKDDFFKPQDRYLQSVFVLPERQPITGIKFDFFPAADPRKGVVIVTTASRIYQFAGAPDRRSEDGGRVFNSLFSIYKDTAPKFLELPGSNQHSELHFYTPNPEHYQSLPKSLAWLTAPGIYHGSLNFASSTPSDGIIDAAQLLPYPPPLDAQPPQVSSPGREPVVFPPEIPTSIALTEFHFVILYNDRVVAVGNLDEKLTFDEAIPLKPGETVQGITVDPVRKTYWIFTNFSLFELIVTNEHRDVWKMYLERGEYDTALRYAKGPIQRDEVLAAQADGFFTQGRFIQSAQSYAQSTRSFEEVTLRFIDAGERDALRYYLTARLERTRKTDVTQRMMLATWLVEFYLSKCNELDDIVASESASHDVQNLQAEKTFLEDELRQFFETYKTNLDKKTIYDLILSHGRTDIFLHFATIMGDYTRVLEHWILEEEWAKAIDVLNRQTGLEPYYRFGPVLMRSAPKETVDAWIRQPSLDPLKLIPSLLQVQHIPRDPLSPNHAIRFLNHLIFEQHNTSPMIHNLLVTFYASPPSSSEDDGPLLRYLSAAPPDPITNKPYYDLDYALRLCKQNGRVQACVHIYSKMGLFENSVDLALLKGDLELAKINADMPEDDVTLRKKLWLKIARYVVQEKKDIKSAMLFLENTDLLKIEDILPFFPDFVVIDDFKEEICNALEGYSAHIEELRAEMDQATQSAESIKKDIAELKNRFVTVEPGERCSTCSYPLLTRQFYVFPCQHTFHADCLIGLVKEYLPATSLRRILALQTELLLGANGTSDNRNSIVGPQSPAARAPAVQRALLSATFAAQQNVRDSILNPLTAPVALGRNVFAAADRLRDLIVPESLASAIALPSMWGARDKKQNNAGSGEESKVEKLREELDDLLASSCPLCESVVAGLDKPFIAEGEVDSWHISST